MTTITPEQLQMALAEMKQDKWLWHGIVSAALAQRDERIKELEAYNDLLRESLKHYANMGQFYTNPITGEREHADIGAPARAALAAKTEGV